MFPRVEFEHGPSSCEAFLNTKRLFRSRPFGVGVELDREAHSASMALKVTPGL
jgi:hypothetical protein